MCSKGLSKKFRRLVPSVLSSAFSISPAPSDIVDVPRNSALKAYRTSFNSFTLPFPSDSSYILFVYLSCIKVSNVYV